MPHGQSPAVPALVPSGRAAGAVIIACAVLTVFAISHHPMVEARTPAQVLTGIVALAPMDRFIHGSVIAIVGALLFGLCIYTLRRGLQNQTAVGGFIAYALGAGALIGAALIDGFLTPSIASHFPASSADEIRGAEQLLRFGAIAIQILTRFGLMAMSAGVFIWSIGLLRGPVALVATGFIGILSSIAVVLAITIGNAHITPHVLVVIVAVQAIWYLAIGSLLVREQL